MKLPASFNSCVIAPILALVSILVLVALWLVFPPTRICPIFDANGAAPVELVTLVLFALVIPIVWLCPPAGGSRRRQVFWCLIWSLLVLVAIVRETDLHRLAFSAIWPDLVFRGTVYKMRFLKAPEIPLAPKLFVGGVFFLFFVSAAIPLLRYLLPLWKGFWRRQATAWTMATFGCVTLLVLIVDRLPANLRHLGVAGCEKGTGSLAALMTILEEGCELIMPFLAILAVFQAYFSKKEVTE